MSEKLTIREMQAEASYLEWAVISASTLKDENIENIWPEMPKDGKWDIKLIVNGVELPIVEAFEQLREQDERRIGKEAIRIIEDKFTDLENVLFDLRENTIRKFSEKLNIEYEEY